jgi:flavin reductase (DIM6/NTAB) family NADH-FMN oxidoreductase RutF
VSPRQATTSAESVTTASFRSAMASFATGVTVVTVRSVDGGLYGMTVNSFSSVSLEPMLVLVCLSGSSRGLKLIEDARVFGINMLSCEQEGVSRLFANRHRPGDSAMFDGVAFELGATGCPALLEAAVTLACRVHQFVPAGDHVIVVGEVVSLTHRPELEPLVFHAGGYRTLASEPVPPGRTPLRVVRSS